MFKCIPKVFQARDDGLNFNQTCGIGVLSCESCGTARDLISFIHAPEDYTAGYQCVDCANIISINQLKGSQEQLVCSCGGELSREHAICCPDCKSKKVTYVTDIIT